MKNASTNRGTTALETLVAFTLLTSVLSLSLPLVVRHARLLADQRHYRLALDELSNQLDRLTALPPGEIEAALSEVAPSEFTSARLAGVKLSGDFAPADVGGRVTLRVEWKSMHPRTVSLAGWAVPATQSDEQAPEEE